MGGVRLLGLNRDRKSYGRKGDEKVFYKESTLLSYILMRKEVREGMY